MVLRNEITPKMLAAAFDDMEEFRVWAEDLLLYDLRYWLKKFEEQEMYEYCAVLRDAIEEYEQACEVIYLYKGFL